MKKILNLTQHPSSAEQVSEGVFDPQNKEEVKDLLTFEEVPSLPQMSMRAKKIALIAKAEGAGLAMIGGAPFFMSILEKELMNEGIAPLYSFSKRESVESTDPDGKVVKKSVFVHGGWVVATVAQKKTFDEFVETLQ